MTDSPEIKFQDIREGDTIRRVWTSNGITQTVEGLAHQLDFKGDWCAKEGGSITDMWSTNPGTLYLIDRPKPQLPTKPGSVLASATLETGHIIGPLVRDMDGHWLTSDVEDGWVAPDEITDFTLGKVVAAEQ